MALTKAHNRMIEGAAFNVRDFGAVGDGVTNDTAAINLAFVALEAAGRGTIFFPSGTYLTSNPIGSNNATGLTDISVMGEVGTVINCNPTTASNYILYLQWPNLRTVRVENIRLQGNTKCATGLRINSTVTTKIETIIVENVQVYDLHVVDDASITTSATGIYVANGGTATEGKVAVIRNCTVHNITRSKASSCSGIVITDFENATVEGCSIKNIQHGGAGDIVDADGIKIFSENDSSDYRRTTSRVLGNHLEDCYGRFVKLQTGGSALVEGNSLLLNTSANGGEEQDLIVNFHCFDSQCSDGNITNNRVSIDAYSGGASASFFQTQAATVISASNDATTQKITNNVVAVKSSAKFPYGILIDPDNGVADTIYVDISNNIFTGPSALDVNTSSALACGTFIYCTIPSTLTADLSTTIRGNTVSSYYFCRFNGSDTDYAGQWYLYVYGNIKHNGSHSGINYSTTDPRTSSCMIRDNTFTSVSSGPQYRGSLDMNEILLGCDFYYSSDTCTNVPSNYTWRRWQRGGSIWTVEGATNMYKTTDPTGVWYTWSSD